MFVLVVDVKTDDFVLGSAIERETVEVVGRVVTDADDRVCKNYASTGRNVPVETYRYDLAGSKISYRYVISIFM